MTAFIVDSREILVLIGFQSTNFMLDFDLSSPRTFVGDHPHLKPVGTSFSGFPIKALGNDRRGVTLPRVESKDCFFVAVLKSLKYQDNEVITTVREW